MKNVLFICVTLLLLISCQTQQNYTADQEGYIYSVNGKMDVNKLGIALTHEHVMSRFGLEPAYIPAYDKDSLFAQVVPYLKKVKSQGINTIFDCTTAYFGRNVNYLKEMSETTGIQIITNTGYYGAANDRYIPESARESSIEDIAKVWINEFENGIDETGIRPGFIKLGFDNGASELDLKLFTAGILAHLSTGLTMAVHTGNNPEAVEEQLSLLDEYDVSPSAWVWVHANKVDDNDLLLNTARKGGWISLDNFKTPEMEDYVSKVSLFKEKGLLNKVLLSHDGNSYNRERKLKEYHAVVTHLIPALKESGFSDEEIDQLLVENPRSAFAIGVKEE